MIYRRGEVVMVDHPFSDARGSKVRPMLIVQSDVGFATHWLKMASWRTWVATWLHQIATIRQCVAKPSDVRNRLLNHTIVAMLTTNLSFVGGDPTQILVDVTTPDGAGSGLGATSAIRCGNLFTLHEKFILRKIGVLSAVLMQQVDDGLRTALELP